MLPHELPPNVSKTLAKAIERGRTLRLVKHTSSVYEVERQEHLPFRVVDLDARTCTRGFPQEHGIPCRHVCRVLMQEKVHPKHFVIPERRVEALKATYLGVTYPVDTSLLQNDGLKAPTQTKRRGRPKKLRIHSSAEKAPRGTVGCGLCGERGYNGEVDIERVEIERVENSESTFADFHKLLYSTLVSCSCFCGFFRDSERASQHLRPRFPKLKVDISGALSDHQVDP